LLGQLKKRTKDGETGLVLLGYKIVNVCTLMPTAFLKIDELRETALSEAIDVIAVTETWATRGH